MCVVVVTVGATAVLLWFRDLGRETQQLLGLSVQLSPTLPKVKSCAAQRVHPPTKFKHLFPVDVRILTKIPQSGLDFKKRLSNQQF